MNKYKCPICKTEFAERVSGVWPFCSERCKMIDLGNWAREDYRVAGPAVDPETADGIKLPDGNNDEN